AAGDPHRRADDKDYDEQIRPLLARYCLGCHGAEKPKRDFRLDSLAPDFADDAGRQRWLLVSRRIKAGEMPPGGRPRPSESEAQLLCDWISGRAAAAEAALRATQGRVVLRRLNRVEYENTVRDLLGVQVELQEMLPADSAAAGFDNVGEALHTSSF